MLRGNIVQRSDFPLFMTPNGLTVLRNKTWNEAGDEVEQFRDKYYMVDSTDDAFYQTYGLVGLGPAVRKPEGTPKRLDSPSMGRPFTLVFPTYALGVAITREAQEDDKKNVLVPWITEELKRSMIETKEQDAADQFNNGFTYQGWETDGVALFSTLHPYIRNQYGTGTQYGSNRHPTNAALSITALDTAYTAMRRLRNDTGRWLTDARLKHLYLPPELLPLGMQIMQTKQVLGSNNNDVNLYYGAMDISSNPRFTDVDAWFARADKHEWIWVDRRKEDFQTKVDEISDVTMLMTSSRWGRGAKGWRGYYVSSGPT